MNTFSHVLLGELLYEHVKNKYGIVLDKGSFIWGNISPDFGITMITRPHYLELNSTQIQERVNKLADIALQSANIGSYYSRCLGVICHYYADFFCHAHSPDFQSGLLSHISYERQLHSYLSNKYFKECAGLSLDISLSRSADEINRNFHWYHSEYSLAKPSFSNDIMSFLQAGTEAVLSLITCSLANAPARLPDCLPNQASAYQLI